MCHKGVEENEQVEGDREVIVLNETQDNEKGEVNNEVASGHTKTLALQLEKNEIEEREDELGMVLSRKPRCRLRYRASGAEERPCCSYMPDRRLRGAHSTESLDVVSNTSDYAEQVIDVINAYPTEDEIFDVFSPTSETWISKSSSEEERPCCSYMPDRRLRGLWNSSSEEESPCCSYMPDRRLRGAPATDNLEVVSITSDHAEKVIDVINAYPTEDEIFDVFSPTSETWISKSSSEEERPCYSYMPPRRQRGGPLTDKLETESLLSEDAEQVIDVINAYPTEDEIFDGFTATSETWISNSSSEERPCCSYMPPRRQRGGPLTDKLETESLLSEVAEQVIDVIYSDMNEDERYDGFTATSETDVINAYPTEDEIFDGFSPTSETWLMPPMSEEESTCSDIPAKIQTVPGKRKFKSTKGSVGRTGASHRIVCEKDSTTMTAHVPDLHETPVEEQKESNDSSEETSQGHGIVALPLGENEIQQSQDGFVVVASRKHRILSRIRKFLRAHRIHPKRDNHQNRGQGRDGRGLSYYFRKCF